MSELNGNVPEGAITLADLERALASIADVIAELGLVIESQRQRLTQRQQVAGSVFVALSQAYYASNGGISCTQETMLSIGRGAWRMADTFAQAEGEVPIPHTGVPPDAGAASVPTPLDADSGTPLSSADPLGTDFYVDYDDDPE
jgi:hypothetical protein